MDGRQFATVYGYKLRPITGPNGAQAGGVKTTSYRADYAAALEILDDLRKDPDHHMAVDLDIDDEQYGQNTVNIAVGHKLIGRIGVDVEFRAGRLVKTAAAAKAEPALKAAV
jgi:hypothetical protein